MAVARAGFFVYIKFEVVNVQLEVAIAVREQQVLDVNHERGTCWSANGSSACSSSDSMEVIFVFRIREHIGNSEIAIQMFLGKCR